MKKFNFIKSSEIIFVRVYCFTLNIIILLFKKITLKKLH